MEVTRKSKALPKTIINGKGVKVIAPIIQSQNLFNVDKEFFEPSECSELTLEQINEDIECLRKYCYERFKFLNHTETLKRHCIMHIVEIPKQHATNAKYVIYDEYSIESLFNLVMNSIHCYLRHDPESEAHYNYTEKLYTELYHYRIYKFAEGLHDLK